MNIERFNVPGLPPTAGFCHVTVVGPGRWVHVSGQVSRDETGKVVGPGDLEAQTEQVYRNLHAALGAAGAKPSDIFKVVTYVVDLTPEKASSVRTVRNRLLGSGPYPASTMVGVTSLASPDLLIEIEAVAAMDLAVSGELR